MNKGSRSVLSRLAMLEQKKPRDLRVLISSADGPKEISVKEFLEMPEEQRNDIDLADFHAKGNNLKDLDRLLYALLGEKSVI